MKIVTALNDAMEYVQIGWIVIRLQHLEAQHAAPSACGCWPPSSAHMREDLFSPVHLEKTGTGKPEIFDAAQLEAIRANRRLRLSRELYAAHTVPVATLIVPGTACSWLVAAVPPHDPDRVLGLRDVSDCDIQIRWPSLKSVRQRFVSPGGEVDCVDFHTDAALGVFAEQARDNGAATAVTLGG